MHVFARRGSISVCVAPEAPDAGPSSRRSPPGVCQSPEQIAERRQVSVMFCDLIGSTSLAARTEPEDLGELLRDYQSRVGTAADQFGGHTRPLCGRRGADPFGLARVRGRQMPNVPSGGTCSGCRGQRDACSRRRPGGARRNRYWPRGHRRADRSGDTCASRRRLVRRRNFAARLQSLADPGNVVIDAATRRQIDSLFDCRELGPRLGRSKLA